MASTSEQLRTIPVDDLRARLQGELITADASTYDDARQVFFKGVDKRPLAVARVASADDVAAVVNTAREGGLELAVRSGGHSRPGYGTVDGGLVIDLSGMDSVEINADDRTAWVETGATAGSYTLATAAMGLGDRIRRQRFGWHRRDHARGRDRVPGAEDRADDRQPIRGRGGDRRRRGRSG